MRLSVLLLAAVCALLAATTVQAAVGGSVQLALTGTTALEQGASDAGLAVSPKGDFWLTCSQNKLYKVDAVNGAVTEIPAALLNTECRGVVIDRAGTHAYVLGKDFVFARVTLADNTVAAFGTFAATDFGGAGVAISSLAIDGADNLYTWASHATEDDKRKAWMLPTTGGTPGTLTALTTAGGAFTAANVPADINAVAVDFVSGAAATVLVASSPGSTTTAKLTIYKIGSGAWNNVASVDTEVDTSKGLALVPKAANVMTMYWTADKGIRWIDINVAGAAPVLVGNRADLTPADVGTGVGTSLALDAQYGAIAFLDSAGAAFRVVREVNEVTADLTRVVKGTGAQTVVLRSKFLAMADIPMFPKTNIAAGSPNQDVTVGADTATGVVKILKGARFATFEYTPPAFTDAATTMELDLPLASNAVATQFAGTARPRAAVQTVAVLAPGTAGSLRRVDVPTAASDALLNCATKLALNVDGTLAYFAAGKAVNSINVATGAVATAALAGANGDLKAVAVDATHIYAIDSSNVYKAAIGTPATLVKLNSGTNWFAANTLVDLTIARVSPSVLLVAGASNIKAIITNGPAAAEVEASGDVLPSNTAFPTEIQAIALAPDNVALYIGGLNAATGSASALFRAEFSSTFPSTKDGFAGSVLAATVTKSANVAGDAKFAALSVHWTAAPTPEEERAVLAVTVPGNVLAYTVTATPAASPRHTASSNQEIKALVARGNYLAPLVLTNNGVTRVSKLATRTGSIEFKKAFPADSNSYVGGEATSIVVQLPAAATRLIPAEGALTGTVTCTGANVPAGGPHAFTLPVDADHRARTFISFTPAATGTTTCTVTALSGNELYRFAVPAAATVTVDDKVSVTLTPTSFTSNVYVNSARTITWSVTSGKEAKLGGAYISLNCGPNVEVTPAKWCMSTNQGTFTVTGKTAATGQTCTASVEGVQKDWYKEVETGVVAKLSANFDVLAQVTATWNQASPVSNPRQLTVGSSVPLELTPGASPSADIEITTTCTNLAGTVTGTQKFTSGATTAATISIPLSTLGFVYCTFAYNIPTTHGDFGKFAVPEAQYFHVIPAAPLKSLTHTLENRGGSWVPASFPAQGSAGSTTQTTTFTFTVTNPLLTGAGDTLIVPAPDCTASTGGTVTLKPTGTPAANSGVAIGTGGDLDKVTFSPAGSGVTATPSIEYALTVPVVADKAMVMVSCTIGALAGTKAAEYNALPTPITFVVGTPQPITATKAAAITGAGTGMPNDLNYATCAASNGLQNVVTFTAGAGIDFGSRTVTVTPSCTQVGQTGAVGTWSAASASLTASGDQTLTYTLPQTAGDVTCTFTLGGTGAAQFTKPADITYTVTPQIAFGITGTQPQSGHNGATEQQYTLTVGNPALPSGSKTVSLQLTCTNGVTVAAVGGDGAAVSGGNTVTFSNHASPANAVFTITAPQLNPVHTSRFSECTWTVSGDAACAFARPTGFSFWSGVPVALVTEFTDANREVYLDQTLSFKVKAPTGTTATINGALTLQVDCGVCGIANTGTAQTDADTAKAITGSPNPELTVVLTGKTAGQVTCRFILGGTDSAYHFTAPSNVVFTVLPKKSFAVTADKGYAGPITGAAATTADSTVLPADTTSVVVTVAAPGLAVSLPLSSCTGATIQAAGGSSLTGTNTVNWLADASAAGTYTLTITAPEDKKGRLVTCSWGTVTGTDAAKMVGAPPNLSIYVGPVVQLTASYTAPAPHKFVGEASAAVTVSMPGTDVITGHEGFSVTPSCVGGTATPTSVTFSANTLTAQTFTVTSTGPETVTCTFNDVTGTDYRHFTKPAETITLNFQPKITVARSGPAVPDANGALKTIAGSKDFSSTTSFTLTPSVTTLLGTQTAVYTAACNIVGGDNLALTLDKYTHTFKENSAGAVTFTVSLLPVGTSVTKLGYTVSCTVTAGAAAPATNWNNANLDFSFHVGTPVTFSIAPKVANDIIYFGATGSTPSYSFTATPSVCTEGSFTITPTCPTGAGSITVTSSQGGAAFDFTYTPPNPTELPTAAATYTCTFTVSAESNGFFQFPASYDFVVQPRATFTLTGLTSPVPVAGQTLTVQLAPSTAPGPGGVTVDVACGSLSLSTPTKFYFHQGVTAAQTFTVTVPAATPYAAYSCTATPQYGATPALSAADADHYRPSTVSFTQGAPLTFNIPTPTANVCAEGVKIVATASAAPASAVTLVPSCTYAGQALTVTGGVKTFNAATLTNEWTVNTPARGVKISCTFVLDGTNKDHFTAPQALSFVSGTQESFAVSPPASLFLVSGATSGAFTVSPPSIVGGTPGTVTLNVAVSSGSVEPAALTFTAADWTSKTFLVKAPTVQPGNVASIAVSFTVGGAAADYFLAPTGATLTAAAINQFTATATGVPHTGKQVTVNVAPGASVAVPVTVGLSCTGGVTVEPATQAFPDNSVTARPFTLTMPSTPGQATCTFSTSGDGAVFVPTPDPIPLTIVQAPADGSSGAGSSGGQGGDGSSSTGGSGGDPDCPECAAFSAASLPSIALYIAMLLAAMHFSKQ